MSPKPTKCRKCGSTKWLQKELRKTGMSIVNGQVVFSPVEESKVQLLCHNCGSKIAEEDFSLADLDSSFPEPPLVEAN